MKRIGFAALLLATTSVAADDWVLLGSDGSGRTYLNAPSPSRTDARETRFQLKLVHDSARDLMGLRYDASIRRYAIACDSNLILSQQQLLLSHDEIVWTFPESTEPLAADRELPGELLRRICS